MIMKKLKEKKVPFLFEKVYPLSYDACNRRSEAGHVSTPALWTKYKGSTVYLRELWETRYIHTALRTTVPVHSCDRQARETNELLPKVAVSVQDHPRARDIGGAHSYVKWCDQI